ncbi:MAG: AAA family ATPase [Anaerolineales bacterium]|nr:AAA family ATPase [Anaerolineales bacterium]
MPNQDIARANYRFVLTGGPGGGKTSLLEALARRGYRGVPDTAREIIKARKAVGQSPRPDPKVFARMVFDADVQNYMTSSDTALTFFDRGVVDSLGMLYESCAMPVLEIEEYLRRYPCNPTVFLLPSWEEIYLNDGERDQTFAEAVQVFERVISWYGRCGYEPLEVPFGPVSERLDFVLNTVAAASIPAEHRM